MFTNYEIFAVGKQPCSNFEPKDEGIGSGGNVHQCYKCGGDIRVSFCENCCRDHHEAGYETCKKED